MSRPPPSPPSPYRLRVVARPLWNLAVVALPLIVGALIGLSWFAALDVSRLDAERVPLPSRTCTVMPRGGGVMVTDCEWAVAVTTTLGGCTPEVTGVNQQTWHCPAATYTSGTAILTYGEGSTPVKVAPSAGTDPDGAHAVREVRP